MAYSGSNDRVNMSINKFGSHIFIQKTSTDNKKYINSDINTLKVVDINKVELYYYIALPFIATFDQSKNRYLVL